MVVMCIPRLPKRQRAFWLVLSTCAFLVLSKLTLSVNKDVTEYLSQNDGWYPPIEATIGPHSTVPPNHNETTTTENASSNLSLSEVTPPPTITTLPIAVPTRTSSTGNVTENPLPPYPRQWIHTPKTGTSFGNALFALSCPEEIISLNVSDEREVDSKSVSGPEWVSNPHQLNVEPDGQTGDQPKLRSTESNGGWESMQV